MKDGRFEIPGCDPEKPGTFYFLDLKDRLGATVELSGKSAAAGPVTVRLRPTASARILLKDADGKLLADHEVDDWLARPEPGHHPRARLRGAQQQHRPDPRRLRLPDQSRPRPATVSCAAAPTAA